jgi:molybdopterin-synthase adenylyltransferase
VYRLLFEKHLWETLDAHLRAAAPDEDGAFFLVRPGRGIADTRLIVHDLLLPEKDAWESTGRHRLRPSGQWLSAVIGTAIECGSGVGFIHSHPDASHPPSLSGIDRETSIEWSRSLTPTVDRPFLSMVWTPTGATGWVFEPGDAVVPHNVDRIEVLGGGMSRWVHPFETAANDEEMDDRQIRALGTLGNARLRQMSVAVVGAGGTGSPMAEQLARMGVQRLTLIDPDVIDTASNLRRIVGSRTEDLISRRPKAEVVGRHIRELGIVGEVDVLPIDVRTERAARTLLDADLVLSTTDTHSGRSFVNQLAYQYLLPVIDVGVKVGTSNTGVVSGMPAEIRVLLPDTGCLWCRGVLDSARIRAENLPEDERRAQEQEGYIQGVAAPQPSLTSLNYFASSLSLITMLRMFSGDGVISPSFIADGWEHYFAPGKSAIDPSCICHSWREMADDVDVFHLPGESEVVRPTSHPSLWARIVERVTARHIRRSSRSRHQG